MFGILKKMANAVNRKVSIMALVALGLILGSVSASAASLPIVTDTAGVIAFDPSVLVDPVTTAIIAAICAVAGIILIVLGARWTFRLCKGR